MKSIFYLGLSNAEILEFIVNFHGIHLSLGQLKRILRKRRCKRQNDQDNLEDVVCAIENELKGSSSVVGYRSMHQRLTNEYGLVVTRNTVPTSSENFGSRWSRISIKTPAKEKVI